MEHEARGESSIGIDDDHLVLRDTVRRWADKRALLTDARATLDADREQLRPWWDELAELGWLGLHLPEEHGGSGYGLVELAVVLEELGRWCAAGSLLPTVVASAAIERFSDDASLRAVLAELADGSQRGGVAAGHPVVIEPSEAGRHVPDLTWDVVMGGGLATLLLLPLPGDGTEVEQWAVVDAEDVAIETLPGVDRTRRPARVRASGLAIDSARTFRCPPGSAGVAGITALLAAAEAVGVAAWCVETAASYACVREQFGRPIGQFQAVKHRCADMLCALESARAATWDAARTVDRDARAADLAVSVAAALGPDAAYQCAKDCVQVLGGIGFTWEHDAHLFLKRAMATRALIGRPGQWQAEIAKLVRDGRRHHVSVELPPEAEPYRDQVRGFLTELVEQPKLEWNRRIGESGYLVPHWPAPWGRDAPPLGQLVIDEEFRAARVRRRHLAVGAWALPTIIAHGNDKQQERFIPPSLRGELTWCQMFSEPGAGSDLAAVSTKAEPTTGGWLLTGQKVWTSLALTADWGICLARTDPDAPRHEGIGCFLVDMRSEGIDIRPLRELTGAELFNEVFLDKVFVPDDCVVGSPTGGWQAARTTLGNERVSMGSGSSMGPGVEALLALAGETGGFDDPLLASELGSAVATAHALAALGTRMTLRALAGAAPGSDASVRKLVGVEHDQRVQEVGLELLGAAAATADGDGTPWVGGFLGNRSLSIAGGTSEIQRNVIAERLLGLPRDGHS